MHLIDAEMVTLDFGDTLELAPGAMVHYSGTYEGEGDGSDLVSRALALVGERRQVQVTKVIAPGAGLGGGSSDAAAILAAAGFSDLRQAAALGADIAFCLDGGRARVTELARSLSRGRISIKPLPCCRHPFTAALRRCIGHGTTSAALSATMVMTSNQRHSRSCRNLLNGATVCRSTLECDLGWPVAVRHGSSKAHSLAMKW